MEFLQNLLTQKNLNYKYCNCLPSNPYIRKSHEYINKHYIIKYKKNFIFNKISVLFKGHKNRVLFFIRLKDKRYLTASKNEIFIWDNMTSKATFILKMRDDTNITKIIQLSNEDIIIGGRNHLYLYKIGENTYKGIEKFEDGIIYDIKEIDKLVLCVVFFKAVYIVNLSRKKNRVEKINLSSLKTSDDCTFCQVLQLTQDNILIFDFGIKNSFIYNIRYNFLRKITNTNIENSNYINTIQLNDKDELIIDTKKTIINISLTGLSEKHKDIVYNNKSTVVDGQIFKLCDGYPAIMKMININNEYYIRRLFRGYGIINAETCQQCTMIVRPENYKTEFYFIPMEKFYADVFLSFGNDGVVYTIE